ncbi:hypothetical protein NC652_024806 [Populus alba x Populus x berolinensis]|nr:hypothetical protein NC652_024806 [Populus alba x Populus x berolinensis]
MPRQKLSDGCCMMNNMSRVCFEELNMKSTFCAGWVQYAFKPRGTSNSSLIAAPRWQHQSSSFPLSFALILALYSAVPGLGLSLVQQLQLKANRVQAS